MSIYGLQIHSLSRIVCTLHNKCEALNVQGPPKSNFPEKILYLWNCSRFLQRLLMMIQAVYPANFIKKNNNLVHRHNSVNFI